MSIVKKGEGEDEGAQYQWLVSWLYGHFQMCPRQNLCECYLRDVRPSVLPSVRVDWSEPESTQPTTTTMAMITMTTMTFFTNNPDLLYLNCFSYLFIPYCVASVCSCQIKQYPSLPQYAILFDLCLGAWPSNIRPSAKTMPSSYIITNKFHYATQCGIP